MKSIKKRLENGDKFNVKHISFAGKPQVFWLDSYSKESDGKNNYALNATYMSSSLNVKNITKKYINLYTFDMLDNQHKSKLLLSKITFV